MDSETSFCLGCGYVFQKPTQNTVGHVHCSTCASLVEAINKRVCVLDQTSARFEEKSVNHTSEEGNCSYCNSVIDLNLEKTHIQNCEMRPTKCIYCDKLFIRSIMKTHERECPCNLHQCKFFSIGCRFHGTQLEMDEHKRDNDHDELLMKLLLQMQNEQFKNVTVTERCVGELLSLKSAVCNTASSARSGLRGQGDQSDSYEKMKLIQENLKETIKRQNREIDVYKQQMAVCTQQMNETKQQMNESKQTFNKMIKELEQKYVNETAELRMGNLIIVNQLLCVQSSQEKVVNYFNESKGDSERKIESLSKKLASSNSIQYIWKIENFKQLQNNAKSNNLNNEMYSDPFFSSEFGYKMRLVLHANGHGDGNGTHLTILQIMKGPNDALLDWPILGKIVFSLLDQSKHKIHHNMNFKTENMKNFMRPVDEFNTARGYLNFFPLNELEPMYLVDDVMFIKANVTLNP